MSSVLKKADKLNLSLSLSLDDSSNIDDNLSLCADQTPSEQLLEGTVKFFEKDIPFVV